MQTVYFTTERSPTLPNSIIKTTSANYTTNASEVTPSVGDSVSGRGSFLSEESMSSDFGDAINQVSVEMSYNL